MLAGYVAFDRMSDARLTPAPVEFLLEPIRLRNFWKADLPRSYILCRQDRAAPSALSAGFIRRLGVEPLEIDSSHSPFPSMPRATAELFVAATRSRPVGPLRAD